MAKVQGALFSIEASGQFAKAMVFDRRGHDRAYNTSSNTQTGPQDDVRQRMLAVQNGISIIGTTTRDAVKLSATPQSSKKFIRAFILIILANPVGSVK